jgi:hypothetical protein
MEGVRGQAHDQEEEDEARPRRRVRDLVALGVEEHTGPRAGSGKKRNEELCRRDVGHAPPRYYAANQLT